MKNFNYLIIAGFINIVLFSACKKEEELLPGSENGTTTTSAESKWGLTQKNTTFYALAGMQLDKFSTRHPHTPQNSVTITGLQPGENIMAIDFRPATGQLYGLGNSSRLYVISPSSGVARMIGTSPFSPSISGSVSGFDFNPTVDRIRVVTSSGQNFRLNPETGALAATDGNINGQSGTVISAVAYNNNIAGQTSTTLYDIDPATDMLYVQNPPNDGVIVPVGSLMVDIDSEGGFDISADNDGFGIFKINNVSTLVKINLTTGEAKIKSTYSINYTAIAIQTNTVSYAINSSNELLIFGMDGFFLGASNNNITTKMITGLTPGTNLIGLDMRPINGQLYALGNNGSIYTINASSGAAILASTLSIPLSGTSFGFDFNPAVDRIRILSNTGQNLRFNPNDGTVVADINLNPANTVITAAAYTNNFAGTTSTALYAIDSNSNQLFQVNPPNNGTLIPIGNLGINTQGSNGFDVGGESNIAYALFKTNYIVISTNKCNFF